MGSCNAPEQAGQEAADVLRCMIVDDNSSFITAAAALLVRDGLDVVGVASTPGEALAAVERLEPDVVLVDVSLGGESGFDVVARLHDLDPAAAVILISTYSQADFAELIEASPAVGFVPKSELSADAVHRLVSERPKR
jgi:DNA-binding NarL/FixJ family response regulator